MWARIAIHVEADFESAVVELKNAAIRVAGFWSGDELDVDFVRLSFHIDVEDTFVRSLGRFRAETVAIDKNAGGRECGSRENGTVDFKSSEFPCAFECAELIDVPREMRPTRKAGFSRDGGLGVCEAEVGCADLVGR